MWHEARKQERKIRGMLVDYRKRAERRQDFYEKIVRILVYGMDKFEVMFLFFFCRRKPIQRNLCRYTAENARFT